jgi:anti-sigma B factor antagonist
VTVQDPDLVGPNQPEQVVELEVSRPAVDVTVLSVRGEVDMVSAPALRAGVTNNLADNGTFVLDMSGVTFLGSAGLAVLVEGMQQSRRRGIVFRIVASDRAVTRPLVATGLGDVFEVHPSVDDAISAARP